MKQPARRWAYLLIALSLSLLAWDHLSSPVPDTRSLSTRFDEQACAPCGALCPSQDAPSPPAKIR